MQRNHIQYSSAWALSGNQFNLSDFERAENGNVDNRYCPSLTDVHFVTDLISKCLLFILTSRLEETTSSKISTPTLYMSHLNKKKKYTCMRSSSKV